VNRLGRPGMGGYIVQQVMHRTVAALFIITACASSACAPSPDPVVRPDVPDRVAGFTLAGQFSIPPLGRFPTRFGLPFGGISGLAAIERGRELLGISDDRDGLRVYRFSIEGEGPAFRVDIVEQVALDAVPGGAALDPEALAVLPNTNLLIASDGIGTEPRVPPALVEYTRHGSFVRSLRVRERFVPNPTGPLQRGVRSNAGFESLTIAPGGDRLLAAVEAPIVQDGDLTTFERGAPTRLLEYVREGDRYEPGREFVYMVEPVHKPPFEPGVAVNGLVELLALGGDEFLALERSFVQERGTAGRDLNRIRLFRIDLAGATDVSKRESLQDMSGVAAVAKTLVLDLSGIDGLSSDLSPSLDNFEGLAFGPALRDGRPTLIMVSDDNLNRTQRTWFLQFAIGGAGTAQRVQ
jgi:hypothetical protein